MKCWHHRSESWVAFTDNYSRQFSITHSVEKDGYRVWELIREVHGERPHWTKLLGKFDTLEAAKTAIKLIGA